MASEAAAEAGAIRRRSILIAVGFVLLLLPVGMLAAQGRGPRVALAATWTMLLAMFLLTVTQRIKLRTLEHGAVAVGVSVLTASFWGQLVVADEVPELVEFATHFGPPNALMAGAAVFLVFGPRLGVWFSIALSSTWLTLVAIRAIQIGEMGGLILEVDELLQAMLAYLVTTALLWALTRQNLTWSTGEAAARTLAERDALTGLPNRRLCERRLHGLLDGPVTDLVIAMVDIDHFKVVNDTHGHDIGDLALKAVARTLEREVREGDLAARWGGEEFVLILTGAPVAQAAIAAERCRAGIEATCPQAGGDADWFPQVTASFGLAAARPGDSAADVRQRADEQLYRAKEFGRNRICYDAGR